MKVHYTTDLCKPYAESLKTVKTVEHLRLHVQVWKLLAADAFDAVNSPQFSWDEYKKGAAKERKGVYAGDDWAKKYGAILMPEVLMQIAIIANEYKVPDGCVCIRLRDSGQLEINNGRAKILKAKAEEGR